MSRDDAPQNAYDDPRFFAGYSQMERFGAAWGAAMEHPHFVDLLPDVRGGRVLDLGCGAGQLALYLAEAGAAEVTALDVSERMLEVARAERSDSRITYRRGAIEDARFETGQFELVVSSLAFHYVQHFAGLAHRIADWLVSDGVLVFSTEHPIYTARRADKGWVLDEGGKRVGWAMDRYADEGLREHEWFVAGVRGYHRTISTILNSLLDASFLIERVVEPFPDERWLRARPQDADELRRPIFLLVRARAPRAS